MMTEQFSVPEVSCQHCVNSITAEVSAVTGVTQVDVDLTHKTVTVTHAPQVTTAAIVNAINEAGYDQVERVG